MIDFGLSGVVKWRGRPALAARNASPDPYHSTMEVEVNRATAVAYHTRVLPKGGA